mmetsp:Transcript_12915/g.29323  ORF Transcript_12915/g.29323 Transcript_12915/m.29323 type:complete len:287 (-) Transcript_12915:409-1269(-)
MGGTQTAVKRARAWAWRPRAQELVCLARCRSRPELVCSSGSCSPGPMLLNFGRFTLAPRWMRMAAPAKSREMSTTLSLPSRPMALKRSVVAVCATLFVTATHSTLQVSTSSLIRTAASPEKYPCVARPYIFEAGAKSCSALQTSTRVPHVSNMSSTTMIASAWSLLLAMILTLPLPPPCGRIRSAIMKPVRSSPAMWRVSVIPPPLVAQTTVLSGSNPGTLLRMKSAKYIVQLNSSNTVLEGANATSASLCRSAVRNRSAPAVFMHRSSSLGGMASPATSRRSCRE